MNKLMLASAVCCIALLSGCGGGGNDEDGGGSSDSVNGVNPVTPLTNTQSSSFVIAGKNKTYTIQSGSSGDIEVVTDTSQAGGISFSENLIQLANGVPSLNVTDIQKTLIADVSCDNGFSVKGTEDHDFSSGNVAISGTFNGNTFSCESQFQSPLPTTVTTSSLEDLLDEWGEDEDDPSFISTSCPEDDDDDPDFNPFAETCSGDILINYTITTSDPTNTHKVSTRIKWE